MKKVILSFLIIATTLATKSQNVGIGTNTPDPSAKLEVSSNNSGFLPPRMSTIERDAIVNPAVGLQVYNTTSHCLEIFDFGKWNAVYCVPIDSTTIVDSTLLTDIDGHIYPTVKICDQIWMAKNLDVARYRNGDIIPQVTDPTEWANLTTGAWCWYNNDSANGAVYGRLYNWYAVNDPRGLAPSGWHVPSDDEWNNLIICLDPNADLSCINCTQSEIAGGKMKDTGTTLWLSNVGATNSSGFNGKPGGYRYWLDNCVFGSIGGYGGWWCTNDYTISRGLYGYNGRISREYQSKAGGFSIRCIKDTPITTLNNGLVAYYPFTGNAGDSSGNGNHGTVNGATLTTDRFGNSGKAYSFDGINDYIVISNSFYNISTSHSMNMWVSVNNVSLGGQYLWNTIPHGAEAFVYNWNDIIDNKVTYCLGNGTSGNWTITCGNQKVFLTSTPSQWKMFTLTYENNAWKIYINGQLSQEFSNSNLPSGIYSLIFGDIEQPNNHESLDGKLDDIRIYNRALTQAEITYLATH
jgi:uncharacterized protein (TIGR02145 family)